MFKQKHMYRTKAPSEVLNIETGYKPRPFQAYLHTALKRFNVLVCHRRFGKCLAKGTKIPTPAGYTEIQNLQVGDIVYSEHGKQIPVKGTYTNKIQDSYRVKFDTGEEVTTDSGHLWYVEPALSKQASSKRKPWRFGKKLTTKELMESKETWFIPLTGKVNYSKKTVPIDPYVFGYWLGDGSSDDGFLYVSKGDEHTLQESISSKNDRGGHYRCYVPKIMKHLKKLNVFKNKHIPSNYLRGSINQRISLLQGMMDSDGTVTSSGTCRFDNKNEKLIDDFLVLAKSLGLKVTKKLYRKRNEFYCLFRGRDFPVFRLERKNKKVLYSNRPIRRKIISVEKTNDKDEFFCIEVDNPSHLFLCTENFIPTHNTVFTVNEMIDQALRNERHNPQYAYIAPTYRQAKQIVWEYFIDFTRNLPNVEVNKSELSIYIHRPDRNDKIKFMLLGAENPDALRGLYLDGAALDEYAQCDPIIWGQIIRPALSDRKGWAIFIGTPKGQNHFYHRLKKAEKQDSWFTIVLRASETGVLDPEEIEDMMADMEEDEIEQELECSFTAAILGSYYGKLLSKAKKEGRITDVPYDSNYPVDTFWDLGIGDQLAIWFRQKVGPSYRYIDYYEANGENLAHFAGILRQKDYNYGRHVLPHDGRARELGTGLTRQETLRSHGIVTEIQKKQAIDDRIQASRVRIQQSWFDKNKCARGLECLFNYQKEWDSKLFMFRPKPKHDWSSNGADAFGYSALDQRDSLLMEQAKKFGGRLQKTAIMDYNEI